jgi:hypothetical protein
MTWVAKSFSDSFLSSNKDSEAIEFSISLTDVELSNSLSELEEQVTSYDVSKSPENIKIERKDKIIFGYLAAILILGGVGVSFYLYTLILENRNGDPEADENEM